MISVEDALGIILDSVSVLPDEVVELASALDRVLCEDVCSDVDIPAFDNSAMDGYAVVASDLEGASADSPCRLTVLEDVPAGSLPRHRVHSGQATRIMTGAPVPEGADTVVMVEDTRTDGDSVLILSQTSRGKNVRRAGEDVRRGTTVIRKGCVVRPAELGMLASVGATRMRVVQRPKVGILATGDELIGPEEPLTAGKVRSSNSYTLYGQVLKAGAIPDQLGIAKDTPDELKAKIQAGLRDNDALITSGGVSVGDYDLVKQVLGEAGADMKFWKVAMKPGRPLAFGVIQGKPAFGLPGNPVASMVSFEQFARPALLKMSGRTKLKRREVAAVLREDQEQSSGRVHFVRAWVSRDGDQYVAETTGPQGSGILCSMVSSNALLAIPPGRGVLKAGEKVTAQLIDEPEAS